MPSETFGGPPTPINRYKANQEMTLRKSEFTEDWGYLDHTRQSTGDYYFKSYAHFGIHEEMLKDSIRTGAYMRAINDNAHLFRDKVVLDVGAGTCVLSMFAAKAGAAHVYAIECSDIVHLTRDLLVQNNLTDKITLIHAKAEEVELPVNKVDIIVSEWMGYFLLYESMLDTIIFCRDKWLVPGGLIFPDRATLHIAGIEDTEYRREKFDFWNNAYDIDFTPVKKCLLEEPTVDIVQNDAIVTDTCTLLDININTCTLQDTNFVEAFRLKTYRKDYIHAFICWFDCTFSCCHVPVMFSTGPAAHSTHWKQTVFYLEKPLTAMKNEEIMGIIAVRKNATNHRDLDIKIAYDFQGNLDRASVTQFHRLH